MEESVTVGPESPSTHICSVLIEAGDLSSTGPKPFACVYSTVRVTVNVRVLLPVFAINVIG